MTTPLLDLTAVRERMQEAEAKRERSRQNPGPIFSAGMMLAIQASSADVPALLDRVEAGESARDHWEKVARGAVARAEAAEAESKVLRSAVETSNDAWAALTTRAEAADAAIQRVRDLVSDSAFNAQDIYGDLPATEYDDQNHAESLLAVTVRALNYAMDGVA